MNTVPKISVVIPFFNRVNLVIRAIDSVYEQTYKDFEVILINDGSTDCDLLIQKKYEQFTNFSLIRLDKNYGPGVARNKGVEVAKGEFIAFLDSDDVWNPSKLETQISFMNKESLGFTYTSYLVSENKALLSGNFFFIRKYSYPYIAFGCRIAMPTVIVRKSILPNPPFINSRVGEDLVLWVNLSKDQPLIGLNIPLSIVYRTKSTTTKSNFAKRYAAKLVRTNCLPKSSFIFYLHTLFSAIKYLFR
jgi:glycosyltransferase involved in cell wall biosynthesis